MGQQGNKGKDHAEAGEIQCENNQNEEHVAVHTTSRLPSQGNIQMAKRTYSLRQRVAFLKRKRLACGGAVGKGNAWSR
jgi:hypothetical protein